MMRNVSKEWAIATVFFLLSGCEQEEAVVASQQFGEINKLENELVSRQREEFNKQLDKQENEIRRMEAELAKLERKNYLKSLRLELLQLKDERNMELAEQLKESKEDEFRLKQARNNLFWQKRARINRMREGEKINDEAGLREEIEELRAAALKQKAETEKMMKTFAHYRSDEYSAESAPLVIEPNVSVPSSGGPKR